MARSKTGPLGLVKGKLSGVVFYERYGRQYIRTAPTFKRKRTFTPNQLLAKRKFAIANKVARLFKPIVKFTYPEQIGTGSPFHKLLGQVSKYAVIGETIEDLRVDFSQIPVSLGSQVPVQDITVDVDSDDPLKLTLNWTALQGQVTDELCLIAVNKQSLHEISFDVDPYFHQIENTVLIESGVMRKQKQFSIDLSKWMTEYTAMTFLFAFFRNAKKTKASSSVYVGCYMNPHFDRNKDYFKTQNLAGL
jgi:hypothetical protein